jgi:alpha-amylase
LQKSGHSTPNVPFTANFTVAQEGRHLLQAQLSKAGDAPARIYIKVDYLGPASLNVP